MKARLIHNDGVMQLLLCNGAIKRVSEEDARSFLLSFDDANHYSGEGTWNYEGLTMGSYRGSTIAYINNEGILCIQDPDYFRHLFSVKNVLYLNVPEYAALHGKQPAIIRRFCLQGRIAGAIQKGNGWLIPEDAPYPCLERPGRK